MFPAPSSTSPPHAHPTRVRRLIARGDDAGLTPCVNEAMLAAAEQGILRNISLLPNAPATEHAVRLFAGRGGFALGLHATITCEWDAPRWGSLAAPEQAGGLLDADGRLPRTVAEAGNRLSPDDALLEVAAQLGRLRTLGADIAYIDDHMAFTWLPGFKEALFRFCTGEGLLFAPSQYNPLPPPTADGEPVDMFLQRLERMHGDVGLAVFHPGRETEALRAYVMQGKQSSRMAALRARDLAVCLDPRVPVRLRELGIASSRYDEIFRVGERTLCADWTAPKKAAVAPGGER